MRLSHNLRFAVRQLWRTPGFSLTVILTLAFGIGANLAIFQVLYGVLFQRLPIAEPNQLYSIHAVKSPYDGQWFFSYPAYQHLRKVTATAAPVIARTSISECIFQPIGRSPERADIQLVSDNFFDVLGISPAAGRFFLTDHEESGQNEWPVVLRYGFWKQSFGEDLSVIGKRAVVNGVPVIIVGVAPERFAGVVAGSAPDLWLPLGAQASGRLAFWFDSLGPGSGANIRASYLNQQSVFWLWLLARVPDAAKSSALSNWTQVLQPDIALLATTAKDTHNRVRILQSRVELTSAESGEGTLREEYSQSLIIMIVMAGLVLLIGCVNLASLQLARLLSRQRELAVRMSLGAGRWSLLRLLLAENLLLALIGGILALGLGQVSSSVLLRWASGAGRTIAVDLHTGWELFALCVVLLVVALISFSVLPAWQITGNNPAAAIQSKSEASQSRTAHNWSSALLAAQVSFSLLLLGAAVLFAQTLVNLIRVDAGLDRDHVISVHLDLENANYQKADLPDYYSRLREQLKTLPAVRDAAVSMCAIPGCIWNTAIHVSGHPEIPEKQMHGEENHVGAGYFRTLGIPMLRGRDFGEQDRQTSQPVAILNHAFARQLFGDESPIGHRIGYEAAPHDADYLIVGETADAKVDDLRSPSPPVAYFSINQRPAFAETIEVRGSGRIGILSSEIRRSLFSLDPNLPIREIVSLSTEYEAGISREILLAKLTGVFGFLALALVAMGFYGLLSFNLTRRTSEIGIRMAIGATRADVYALVLRQVLGILIAGIIPGLAFTEAMGFIVRSLLYGAGTINLWPLSVATCVLMVVGILAGFRPAYRAAHIDPVRVIRAD
ncbi:MAG TPA: ADOP family duplicated permease [Terriglobales bacterium]|nr:ADOP family duplicated permease [Terriglobales bacterium]